MLFIQTLHSFTQISLRHLLPGGSKIGPVASQVRSPLPALRTSLRLRHAVGASRLCRLRCSQLVFSLSTRTTLNSPQRAWLGRGARYLFSKSPLSLSLFPPRKAAEERRAIRHHRDKLEKESLVLLKTVEKRGNCIQTVGGSKEFLFGGNSLLKSELQVVE